MGHLRIIAMQAYVAIGANSEFKLSEAVLILSSWR